jgi:hypothetical protein
MNQIREAQETTSTQSSFLTHHAASTTRIRYENIQCDVPAVQAWVKQRAYRFHRWKNAFAWRHNHRRTE